MSQRSRLETWIAAANAVQVATEDSGALVALPLITAIGTSVRGFNYESNLPLLLIPEIGELYNEGEVFTFKGVVTAAPVDKTNWLALDNNELVFAMNEIAKLDLGQAGISSFKIMEEPIEEPKLVVEGLSATETYVPGVEPEVSLMAAEAAAEPEVDTVEVPDFSKMTKKEIDVWSAEEGIEVDGRLSKADMVEFVEAELAKR